MRTRKQRLVNIGTLALLLSVTLFSFLPKPGADHFEVYLNKKLIFQQYVGQQSSPKSLALDQRNLNDQVDVLYSHCGKIGSKRTITIKDGKNVLKQWRFADVDGQKASAGKLMSMSAKDILALQQKGADRKLNLYYSSEELPDARFLASIILDTDNSNKALP